MAESSTVAVRLILSFDTSPPPYESMKTIRHFDAGSDDEISLSGYWNEHDGSTWRDGGSSRAQRRPVPAAALGAAAGMRAHSEEQVRRREGSLLRSVFCGTLPVWICYIYIG